MQDCGDISGNHIMFLVAQSFLLCFVFTLQIEFEPLTFFLKIEPDQRIIKTVWVDTFIIAESFFLSAMESSYTFCGWPCLLDENDFQLTFVDWVFAPSPARDRIPRLRTQ